MTYKTITHIPFSGGYKYFANRFFTYIFFLIRPFHPYYKKSFLHSEFVPVTVTGCIKMASPKLLLMNRFRTEMDKKNIVQITVLQLFPRPR